MHKFFQNRKFCETFKGSPTKIFGTVRQTNFDGKTWDPPLIQNFFHTRKFLKRRRAPLRIFSFRSCGTKTFRQYCDAPPPMHEIFQYQKFFEAQNGSLTKFFSTERQKFFDGKSWYPLLMHKFFQLSKIFDTSKCSPTNFISTVRQKFLNEKWWYPPLSHKIKKSVVKLMFVENLRKLNFTQ